MDELEYTGGKICGRLLPEGTSNNGETNEEQDLQEITDLSGVNETLLSFEPFCPTLIDMPKRPGWLKRTIKSAGSTISKMRGSSSKPNRVTEKQKLTKNATQPLATYHMNDITLSAMKSEESKPVSEEVEILSYSSVRSGFDNPPPLSATCDAHSANVIDESKIDSSSATAVDVNEMSENQHLGKKKDETKDKQDFCGDGNTGLSKIEKLLQNDRESKTYVEKCSKFAKYYMESVKFRYEDLEKECIFDPNVFNINEPSPLQKFKDAENKEKIISDPESPAFCVENDHESSKVQLRRKVGFVAQDGHEIQLFDSNLPPCTTERNKNHTIPPTSNGVLSTSNRIFKYTDSYNKFEDVTKLGPVPFPDLSLKERMTALFELVGAPEELKECNDLRLSLTCLHPCLAKILGFLWRNINVGLKENNHLRNMVKRLEKQRLIDSTAHESKQEEFSKLTTIHVQKLNDLERTLQEVEVQYSRQKAHNNSSLELVNTAMEGMTGVLNLFFSQEFYEEWQKDTKDRIDSLMVYLNDICQYFSTMQTEMILKLEHNAEMNELTERCEFYTENCSLLERENESLKAVASAYRQLQDIVTEKNIIISSLEVENRSLKKQVETKAKDLELLSVKHEREIAKLKDLSKAERGRILKVWDRTDYEKALDSKEEEIVKLNHRISLLDLIIDNKVTEIKNNESRYRGLETKVAILSNENIVLKSKHDEVIKKKKEDLAFFNEKFQKRLLAMKREIDKNADMYHNELQSYRTNYEKTLSSALKVTLKAESALSAIYSNNVDRFGSTNRTLNYFMKKRDMFQNIRDNMVSNKPKPEYKPAITITSVSDGIENKDNRNEELHYISEQKQGFNDSLRELKVANVNSNCSSRSKHNAKQIIQKLREWKQNQNTSELSPDKEDSIFSTGIETDYSTSNIAQLSTRNWASALKNNYNAKYLESI